MISTDVQKYWPTFFGVKKLINKYFFFRGEGDGTQFNVDQYYILILAVICVLLRSNNLGSNSPPSSQLQLSYKIR